MAKSFSEPKKVNISFVLFEIGNRLFFSSLAT